MYFILPETEQRTLDDIELHFSDNTKGITDINIPKSSRTAKNEINNWIFDYMKAYLFIGNK